MKIDKDTKLYGSFSKQAGSKGCEFFNNAFQKYGINAIYKSFSVDNIEDALKAAKTLKMAGFAISMPFKIETYKILSSLYKGSVHSASALLPKCFGVINTIINKHDLYHGYNTDYIGVMQIIKERIKDHEQLYIIGKGGLAKSVGVVWTTLTNYPAHPIITITTELLPILKNLEGALIYNCSPGDYSFLAEKNDFIDCRVGTPDGDRLFEIQAKAQFKLYTGIDYEE